jgi:hypothetical protein
MGAPGAYSVTSAYTSRSASTSAPSGDALAYGMEELGTGGASWISWWLKS